MLIINPIDNNHTKSILIVDDDQTLLELLGEVFEMYGLKVFRADNGLDGWNLFNNECIDIVLTDIQMHGMDGAELSKRIRNESPKTKIAVVTGGDDETAHRLVEGGIADFFFKKPFALSYLCKTVITATQMV